MVTDEIGAAALGTDARQSNMFPEISVVIIGDFLFFSLKKIAN